MILGSRVRTCLLTHFHFIFYFEKSKSQMTSLRHVIETLRNKDGIEEDNVLYNAI